MEQITTFETVIARMFIAWVIMVVAFGVAMVVARKDEEE